MELRTKDTRKFVPRPVNICAQCGDTIFMPEWSEHVDDCRVRHLWACQSCGYAFETTVRFAPLSSREVAN
jgi:ribosomal protein S27AE